MVVMFVAVTVDDPVVVLEVVESRTWDSDGQRKWYFYYRNYLSVNGVVVVGTGSRRCANIVAVDEANDDYHFCRF
jgi:hypothetical protein